MTARVARRSVASAFRQGWRPYRLFFGGEAGFLFDFSKLDQLFQENGGYTPVNADAQTIGFAFETAKWNGRNVADQVAIEPVIAGLPLNASPWTTQSGAVRGANSVTGAANGDAAKLTYTFGRTYRAETAISSRTGSWYWLAEGVGVTYRPNLPTSGDGSTTFRAAGGGGLLLYCVAAGAITLASLAIKQITGEHGDQTTSAARPKYYAPGVARFDRSDDNLLTPLNPSTAMTLAVKMKPNSDAASRIAIGSALASNGRCFLGVDSSGNVVGGIGADSLTTIKGATNRNDSVVVAILTADGTTVRLYENGVQTYSAAQNGAIGTTVPLRIGALNANGTASTFFGGDLYQAEAINRALTPAEVAALTSYWGTT